MRSQGTTVTESFQWWCLIKDGQYFNLTSLVVENLSLCTKLLLIKLQSLASVSLSGLKQLGSFVMICPQNFPELIFLPVKLTIVKESFHWLYAAWFLFTMGIIQSYRPKSWQKPPKHSLLWLVIFVLLSCPRGPVPPPNHRRHPPKFTQAEQQTDPTAVKIFKTPTRCESNIFNTPPQNWGSR